MPSITAIPTGEHLFVRRSDEIAGGVALGLQLRKGVSVSVHLERAQAEKLEAALARLTARSVPKQARKRRP